MKKTKELLVIHLDAAKILAACEDRCALAMNDSALAFKAKFVDGAAHHVEVSVKKKRARRLPKMKSTHE